MERSLGDEHLTMTRCHSCVLPQLYEALEGWKSVCGRAYNLKGINLFLFYYNSFHGMMRAKPGVTGMGNV